MTDAELNERLARTLGWTTFRDSYGDRMWRSPDGLGAGLCKPGYPVDFTGDWRHCGPLRRLAKLECYLYSDDTPPTFIGLARGVEVRAADNTEVAEMRALCEAALKVLEAEHAKT